MKLTFAVRCVLVDLLHDMWPRDSNSVEIEAAGIHLRRFLQRHTTLGSALAEWPGLACVTQGCGLSRMEQAKATRNATSIKKAQPWDPTYLNELIVRLKVLQAVA